MNPELENAIAEIQKRNLQKALSTLVDFLKKNPTDEDGWSCLYSCLEKKEEKLYCLKKILKVNPENHHAAYELRMLSKNNYRPVDFPIVRADSRISTRPTNIKFDYLNEKPKNKQIPSSEFLALPNKPKELSKENKKPPVEKKKNTGHGKGSLQREKTKHNKQEQDPISIKFRSPTVINNSKTLDLFTPSESIQGNFSESGGVMFGPNLITGGITIRLNDLPACFRDEDENPIDCQLCDFFSEEDCPLQRNVELFNDAKSWFDIYKNSRQEYEEHRKNIVDAIYAELKSHGRPLHYHLLTRIIQDRYPDLELNSYNIIHIMSYHPEKFEGVGDGVYRAK